MNAELDYHQKITPYIIVVFFTVIRGVYVLSLITFEIFSEPVDMFSSNMAIKLITNPITNNKKLKRSSPR
jgi:hypothetical protein